MSNHKAESLIKAYIDMRDKVAAIDKKVREEKAHLKEGMDILEAELSKILKEVGTESLKAKGIGTAFKAKKDYVTVKDWHEFQKFLVGSIIQSYQANGNDSIDTVINGSMLHMLNKAVSKTVVKEFLDEEDKLPPGIGYDVENVIQIRKA